MKSVMLILLVEILHQRLTNINSETEYPGSLQPLAVNNFCSLHRKPIENYSDITTC